MINKAQEIRELDFMDLLILFGLLIYHNKLHNLAPSACIVMFTLMLTLLC